MKRQGYIFRILWLAALCTAFTGESLLFAQGWPAMPERDLLTAEQIARQSRLPLHDLTVGAALSPALPAKSVLFFSGTKSLSVQLNPGVHGSFDLSIAHLVGGSFAPLQVSIDGEQIGETIAVEGPVRPVVSSFHTPILRSHGVVLTLTAAQPASIGLIHLGWENKTFELIPSEAWKFNNQEDSDSEKVTALTYLFRPTRGPGVELRLSGGTDPTVRINEELAAVRMGQGGRIFSVPGDKLRYGLNRVEVLISAKDKATFQVESNPYAGRFFREVPDGINPELNIDPWPRAVLSNGLVTASVALPDPVRGFYRGPRFDPSSMITSLTADGHSYFGVNASGPRNPVGNDHGAGPAEEFYEVLGFDEVKIGEPFLKIGVGLLEKPLAKNYFFGDLYWPLKKFEWKWEVKESQIDLVQTGALRGWGYTYQKQIRLLEGQRVLEIHYNLINTGERQLTTSQYAHSFIRLDNQPTDKRYAVTFAGRVKPLGPLPTAATFTDGKRFTMPGDTMFIPLAGFRGVGDNRTTVALPNGTGITVSGDFTPFRYWLYASAQVVCPESFILIDLAPGENMRWTRRYELHRGDE